MLTKLIQELIDSLIQVVIFTLIPFIVWLVTARKKESFFSWIGLRKFSSSKKECAKYGAIAIVICEIVGLTVTKLFLSADWNKSSYSGMGISGFPCIVLFSYIHTALSEEILFRGFIQKRLQSIFSFKVATIIQAVIFGFAHIVLLLDRITFVQGAALVLFPIIPGIMIAYINEKKAEGSIIPGWIMHGTMNLISHMLQL